MQIDNNITIPMPKGAWAKKYRIELLKVGESILIENVAQHTIACRMAYLQRTNKNKVRYTCRKDASGVRVWRYS